MRSRPNRLETVAAGGGGAGNVFVGMRGTNKERFELRRRQINSSIQHEPEEASETRRIGTLGGFVIGGRTGAEKEREHGTVAVHRNAGGDRGAQYSGARFELMNG